MQMVKCLRCDTIAPLILTDAGGVQIDIEGDNIDVDVVDGFLTFLCGNCVTEEEANSFLLSLVATQLSAVEENLKMFNSIMKNAPNIAEDADFKRHVAQMEKWQAHYTEAMEALIHGHELPEEENG